MTAGHTMSFKNRRRLIALARFLDRRAASLRAYVRRVTPKRERRMERGA